MHPYQESESSETDFEHIYQEDAKSFLKDVAKKTPEMTKTLIGAAGTLTKDLANEYRMYGFDLNRDIFPEKPPSVEQVRRAKKNYESYFSKGSKHRPSWKERDEYRSMYDFLQKVNHPGSENFKHRYSKGVHTDHPTKSQRILFTYDLRKAVEHWDTNFKTYIANRKESSDEQLDRMFKRNGYAESDTSTTDVHPYQESESSGTDVEKHEFKSKAEAMKYMKNGDTDDADDLGEDESNIKGAIFTRASNVKQRLKRAFVPFEKDLYMIKRLMDTNKWDHHTCHDMYWERAYWVGNSYVVETSGPLSRMRTVGNLIRVGATKKRCRKAFTDEEYAIMQDLWKEMKNFIDNERKAQNSNGRSIVYNFGLCGRQFAENLETYEKVIVHGSEF